MNNHTIAGLVAETKSLDASDVQELRDCISGIAAHNATVTFVDGNVTVVIDAKLTDAEREAVARLCNAVEEYTEMGIDEAGFGVHWKDDLAAVDVCRGLLARASGQTSGQDSLAQSQSAPEITPACAELEPAKQTVTLTDAERAAVAWAIAVTCTMPHDPIGPIQRERLRDLIARAAVRARAAARKDGTA